MAKMHPIAEAALKAAGKAGRKAIAQAATEGLATAVDSVLEDIEKSTGGISANAREARDRIRTRKEETMGRQRKARGAREEEEDVRDEDEEPAEEDADEDAEEDEEASVDILKLDAEVLIRNAIYLLEAGAEEDKNLRKILRKAEDLHEELVDLIDDE